MSSSSSHRQSGSNGNNNGNINNNNNASPKLVSSLRNSKSSDDSYNGQPPTPPRIRRRSETTTTPTNTNTNNDHEEDEIPDLVDEDEGPYELPLAASQQHQQQQRLLRHQSLPSQQQQQQRLLPQEANSSVTQNNTTATAKDATAKDATAKDVAADNALPFFMFDRMLDDLVPNDQNAQDLAKLLNEQESSQKPRRFSPIRKSKSCGVVGLSKSKSKNKNKRRNNSKSSSNMRSHSPIIQRFLPWSTSKKTEEENSDSENDSDNDNDNDNDSQQQQHLPVSPSPNSNDSISDSKGTPTQLPPMPVTPKSSNRRKSRLRQRECWRNCGDTDNDNDSDVDSLNDIPLFVPRNLNNSLEECDTTAASTAVSNKAPKNAATAIATAATAPQPLPKLMPRVTSSAPQQATFSKALSRYFQDRGKSSPKWKASAKKSTSCPQFGLDKSSASSSSSPASNTNTKAKATQQLRQRAKEQLDRRERRNKLTIIQRSLTLAQGWNNKGLSMAGKATRAEHCQLNERNGKEEKQHEQHEHEHEQKQKATPEQWWESSLDCWDNALEIYRSLLGEYHERVADVQNNRGIALGKLGRFEDALGALGMALEARKKQEERAVTKTKSKNNKKQSLAQQQQQQRGSTTDSVAVSVSREVTDSEASAAIVSTLHNIANVFRDARNPDEALRVLIEAQNTLLASQERELGGNGGKANAAAHVDYPHRYHCWHQSARLSTAIGHVYYESESWRDAREAYGEALEVYHKLSRSVARQSDRLAWGHRTNSNNNNNCYADLSTTGDNNQDESQRLELLQHQQLIQREVSYLERDLEELDRCQQAKEGSRVRLLQARRQQQQQQQPRQQQQQQKHEAARRMQKQQPQQQPQQQQTLFGLMSSLRA